MKNSMRNGKSGRNRQNKRKSGRGGRTVISHPPEIRSYGITHDVRIRFQSGVAINQGITYQNLLDTINIATGATSAFQLFNAVRVNSVEMWATPVTGAPVTVGLVFSSEVVGSVGDLKSHTDTSMGIQPAHVKASPDRLTQAGQFQPSNANIAFTLDVPALSVVDVSLSYRQPVLALVTAVQNAPVAATAGGVYYRGLDGKALSVTSIPVVGPVAAD